MNCYHVNYLSTVWGLCSMLMIFVLVLICTNKTGYVPPFDELVWLLEVLELLVKFV